MQTDAEVKQSCTATFPELTLWVAGASITPHKVPILVENPVSLCHSSSEHSKVYEITTSISIESSLPKKEKKPIWKESYSSTTCSSRALAIVKNVPSPDH